MLLISTVNSTSVYTEYGEVSDHTDRGAPANMAQSPLSGLRTCLYSQTLHLNLSFHLSTTACLHNARDVHLSATNMDTINRTSLDTSGASFGLFTDWALRTPTSYGITIVLLFTLGLLGRFLGAVKWQLERSWRLARTNTNRNHDNYVDFHENDGESEPLSPDDSLVALEKRRHVRQFWVADDGRNMKQDGMRALLEFARAVIAYVL